LEVFPIIAARFRNGNRNGEQFPATAQVLGAMPIPQEAVVADAVKTIRENIEQERRRNSSADKVITLCCWRSGSKYRVKLWGSDSDCSSP